MQSTLRLGRVGPLNVYLNYTWLLATVLGLWWVALLWLPDNFPGWGGIFYWLVALAVIVLYLLSVIAHELVHSAVSRDGTRTINLFPFGAAVPFKLQSAQPGRAIAAAVAAPIFNLAMSGLLLALGGMIADHQGIAGGIKALVTALGWLNLWLGLINLIPGIPFDGGWALSASTFWFSGDRDASMRVARSLGGMSALLLMLAGALLGLTTDQWLPSLSLVLAGWAAREASDVGRHRTLLRGAFEQMTARNFMDRTRPTDAVHYNDSIADMVAAHPRFPPDTPLAVLDEQGTLTGIITLSAAERLLQGNWPATPARSLATPIGEIRSLAPDSPLPEVLEIAQTRRGTPHEEYPIPVIADGKLVGAVDPSRLDVFGQVGQEFGIEEANEKAYSGGLLPRIGALLPIVMVIAAMAILGNLALRTNPADLNDLGSGDGPSQITFANLTPADGAIVDVGDIEITAQVSAPREVTTATMILDGSPIEVQLSGTEALTKTLTAQSPGLAQGIHDVTVTASTQAGKTASAQWQFRVSARGDAPSPTTQPVPAADAVEVTRYNPMLAAQVLAGANDLTVSVDVTASQPPKSARLSLDGTALDTTVEPVQGAESLFRVSGVMPALPAGPHRARLELEDAAGGVHSSEWTFTALTPDANNAYFQETGQFVSQPFLQYWQENGGLAVFGFPISGRIQETVTSTNETYTAQYFERARFELHPATGDQVILGRLGALMTQPQEAATPLEGAQFFPETGHNLSGPFLNFWNQNGGLAIFGFPITEELIEKNPVDGKEYTVQYFERNRFELHPENAGTPFEVQLGQLGTQLYDQNYK
ncbi:MAG TPA: site-2 protease family protein [Chloroflexia bacterium]|nr:site-2 protease family protein [Chloroflexia bacterium]